MVSSQQDSMPPAGRVRITLMIGNRYVSRDLALAYVHNPHVVVDQMVRDIITNQPTVHEFSDEESTMRGAVD